MNPHAALRFFKTRKEIIRICQVSASAVAQWFKNDKVPPAQAIKLFEASRGKVPLTAQSRGKVKTCVTSSGGSRNAAPRTR
jgi:hypothetical protein